jgi:hypothetical protein
MSPPKPPPKKVDWGIAKRCLAELHRLAPMILQQGILIGGGACWFYRNRLKRANDSCFPMPLLTQEEEAIWLSKDIDFTNFFIEDARQLLADHLRSDDHGRRFIEVAEVPIGFAQVGVTFDPEAAWLDAWIGSFESDGIEIQFRVLDPVSLYREKQALAQKRRSQADGLHLGLLGEFLRFQALHEITELERAAALEERTFPVKFLTDIKDRAPEILKDPRMVKALQNHTSPASLLPLERKLISSLLEIACE